MLASFAWLLATVVVQECARPMADPPLSGCDSSEQAALRVSSDAVGISMRAPDANFLQEVFTPLLIRNGAQPDSAHALVDHIERNSTGLDPLVFAAAAAKWSVSYEGTREQHPSGRPNRETKWRLRGPDGRHISLVADCATSHATRTGVPSAASVQNVLRSAGLQADTPASLGALSRANASAGARSAALRNAMGAGQDFHILALDGEIISVSRRCPPLAEGTASSLRHVHTWHPSLKQMVGLIYSRALPSRQRLVAVEFATADINAHARGGYVHELLTCPSWSDALATWGTPGCPFAAHHRRAAPTHRRSARPFRRARCVCAPAGSSLRPSTRRRGFATPRVATRRRRRQRRGRGVARGVAVHGARRSSRGSDPSEAVRCGCSAGWRRTGRAGRSEEAGAHGRSPCPIRTATRRQTQSIASRERFDDSVLPSILPVQYRSRGCVQRASSCHPPGAQWQSRVGVAQLAYHYDILRRL